MDSTSSQDGQSRLPDKIAFAWQLTVQHWFAFVKNEILTKKFKKLL